MAVKPSECDGMTQEMILRVEAAETSIDNRLRGSYQAGREIRCPTGHTLNAAEKKLLAKRYAADWNVTFDYSRSNGETIAVIRELNRSKRSSKPSDKKG